MADNTEPIEITLIGEDGAPVTFEHVLTFMYDNERYMALAPADLIDEDDEEVELVFMHIVKENGEDALSLVDNEVLLDELFEVFCSLMDEEAEEEDDSEE